MRPHALTPPQLMFLIGTRLALGAGMAFLASDRLNKRQRKMAGVGLALFGAVTTIPAARLLLKKPSWRDRLKLATA